MPSTRTFIALAIPEAQSEKLTRLQSLLAPEIASIRWSVIPPFHITLAFLGDVGDTDLNTVCQAVRTTASSFAPFDLRLQGVGAFPEPSRARTLWAGLAGPDLTPLLSLQSAISQAVAEAGYPTGETSFTPHVTLGRLQKGQKIPPDISAQAKHFRSWGTSLFKVSEVTTFASAFTREGALYAPLSTAPLTRRKV